MTRVVLITGSSGGIGSASVRAFADAGWLTIGIDCIAPGDCKPDRFVQVDLAAPDAEQRVMAAVDDLPQLDALVNNAALQIARPLLQLTAEDWLRTFDVNVRAAAMLTSAFAGRAGPQGGAVVNVASVHAVATSPGMAAYVASKGALVALTRACALELAPRGVRVNAVLPGAVNTHMLAEGLARAGEATQEAMASLAARTPLGRVGRPEEIAQAVLFLADASRSSFITGQTLVVDGGATARLSTE